MHQYTIDACFHSLIPLTGAPGPNLAIMPAVEWTTAECEIALGIVFPVFPFSARDGVHFFRCLQHRPLLRGSVAAENSKEYF